MRRQQGCAIPVVQKAQQMFLHQLKPICNLPAIICNDKADNLCEGEAKLG